MIVELSDRAKADLRAIGLYIAQDNPERGVSFVDELLDACVAILEFPRSHPIDRRFTGEVRRKRHGSYHIIFENNGEKIVILTIVHVARDPDALP